MTPSAIATLISIPVLFACYSLSYAQLKSDMENPPAKGSHPWPSVPILVRGQSGEESISSDPFRLPGPVLRSRGSSDDPWMLRHRQFPSGRKGYRGLATAPLYDGPGPTWVRYYFTNDRPSNDSYSSLVVDHEGNAYVAGSSEDFFPSGGRALLAKYNNTGVRQWLVRDSSVNDITSLMIDSSGSLIALGSNSLMKFTDAGSIIWKVEIPVIRYLTRPYLDKKGNIYISYLGETPGPLVKYSPEGKVLWSIDTTGLFAVDSEENVFMVRPRDINISWYSWGEGRLMGAGSELVIIKYDSTGAKQWEDQFTVGPLNSVSDITLIGSEITIVAWFVVTGGQEYIVLLRYSVDGLRKWTWTNRGGGLCAVDPKGSVYLQVVDYSRGSFALLKVTEGTTRWGAGDRGYDWGDIALDPSGNIVVSWLDSWGGLWATAKYDTNGTRLWKAYSSDNAVGASPPTHLDVGTDGRIFVMGYLNGGYYQILQFSPDGLLNRNFGLDSNWTPSAYALDQMSNLYLIGHFTGEFSGNAVLTKIRAAGGQDWVARYEGQKIPVDFPAGFGLDSIGNVYVLSDKQVKTNAGFAIVKYDPDGNIMWVKEGEPSFSPRMGVGADGAAFLSRTTMTVDTNSTAQALYLDRISPAGVRSWSVGYQPPDNVYLSPSSPLIDASGSIYVVADRSGPDETSAIFIQKFTQTGNILWSRESAGNPPASRRHLYAVALDNSGNLLITGQDDLPNGPYSGLVMKLSPAGQPLWTRMLVSGSAVASPWAVTSDESGSVYVTGVVTGSSVDGLVIIKYDSAGSQKWLKRDQACGFDVGTTLRVAIDKNRSVFVVGTDSDSSGIYCVTTSFDSLGERRWIGRQFVSGFDTYWVLYAFPPIVKLDRTGDLYVTCSDSGLLTTKYTSAGVRSWSTRFAEPGWAGSYIPFGTSLDGRGRLYVTGGIGSFGYGRRGFYVNSGVIATLRYDLGATGIETPMPTLPVTYALSQNYPNPFNPATKIQFSIVNRQLTMVKVYDVLGREVRTLVNEVKEPGTYTVQWDASKQSSGVYLCRMTAGTFMMSRKMLLTK